MPCFECSFDCPLAGKTQSIRNCPQCGMGMVIKKKTNGIGFFLGCKGYPSCSKSLWFPPEIDLVESTRNICNICKTQNQNSFYILNFKFNPKKILPGDPTEVNKINY